MIRVLHIIVDLDIGGAELMLKRLVESQQNRADYRLKVISLTGIGKVGRELQSSGVEVEAMGMRSALDTPRALWRLVRRIRTFRPDIVQTWMYHADLLGGLAARLAGNRNVIWGVRGTAIPQRGVSATQLVVRTCSILSRFLPRMIVCCAESARVFHVEMGYDRNKMVVIPNGYDLSCFNSTPTLRRHARDAFGFCDDDIIVGIIGRFDRLKDHRNFVLAASAVASRVERVKFLMVGRGIDDLNRELKGWLTESGYGNRFFLVGEYTNIPKCLAAMDVFCLSSRSEGFPNVVCEAMAMKLPCVVTDTGDAAMIVSDTGIVVAPCAPTALAEALQTMICKDTAERLQLGELARRRIEENYSIDIAAARFGSLYKQAANHTCQEQH